MQFIYVFVALILSFAAGGTAAEARLASSSQPSNMALSQFIFDRLPPTGNTTSQTYITAKAPCSLQAPHAPVHCAEGCFNSVLRNSARSTRSIGLKKLLNPADHPLFRLAGTIASESWSSTLAPRFVYTAASGSKTPYKFFLARTMRQLI